MIRRQYSDEDKATALAALAANGGNVRKTSRDLGMPYDTLRSWAKGENINQGVVKLQPHKKKALADKLEDIAHKLAGALPEKIEEASLQQTATSLGIVVDKMQLLRGQPTNITDDASLTDDERAKRVASLLDAARARRDGQALDGEDKASKRAS